MTLLAFALVTVLVHGPLSPLLPTAYEAALLYYVRLYPAWLLALVGTLAASAAEVVNYRLLDWATALPRLAAIKERPLVRWSVEAFLRAPFWATAWVIFSPIPDTVVRILAPLGRYPLHKFVIATAVGRFPRFLLIAGLGLIVHVPVAVLLLVSVGIVAVSVARKLLGTSLTQLWIRASSIRRSSSM